MIFYPQQNSSERGDAALSRHLAGQLAALCGESELVASGQMDELASAVADFVTQTNASGTVSSSYLAMLASKALTSLGERHAAHRVLLLGTGLVRPSQWEVTGNDTMWVLDLKEMTVQAETCLELVFFNSLTVVVDMIAEIWDHSKGSGVLGLRHVSSAAASLLGRSRDSAEVERVADEIREMCCSKLEGVRVARGWTTTPLVMDLDLEG